MAGDWRISADERSKYETYFQQCGPVQGFVTGEHAREFFVKSGLPSDALRKIWDLSDITADGRLDKREFAIACFLIASQVQKKFPLPASLPPSFLADLSITSNGLSSTGPLYSTSIPSTNTLPLTIAPTGQPLISNQPTGNLLKSVTPIPVPPPTLTPNVRSKYLQQFHSLVDVTKTNGFMGGLQAKNILQHTGLSQTLLHQIWTLADADKDGRLTPDEFVIAMHCCDIARAGQPIPSRLPDEWSHAQIMQRERSGSLGKSGFAGGGSAFSALNEELKNALKPSNADSSDGDLEKAAEAERKNSLATYEEKRQKNYEEGVRELERRRQLLREQEERDQKEREERERKRELELQKQKDEQERKKQMEIERQLEKQRQIEQQREEERRKLLEQREAARKEMERKSRLEWERQRMQELLTQKSRLLEQINDLKSREKALELELQSMDDTTQTCESKINQTNTAIQSIEESIAQVQRQTNMHKNEFENVEQQRKEITARLSVTRAERESLDSSLKQLNQSKEFGIGNREADQIKMIQTQVDNLKQESTQIDVQLTTMTDQCKDYQNQMEQLRNQLSQLELDAKKKKPASKVTSPTSPTAATAAFPNYNEFRSDAFPSANSNDFPVQSPTISSGFFSAGTVANPVIAADVDPFQTVDPFASSVQSETGPSSTANHGWFQPTVAGGLATATDPFLTKNDTADVSSGTASPRMKKAAPKVAAVVKETQKPPAAFDPWGGSSTAAGANNWAEFKNENNTPSPFEATSEWPQPPPSAGPQTNGQSATGMIKYRALYDYVPERPDEMAISIGDEIWVDPTQQQDEQWPFGRIGNNKQGVFPAAYAERISSVPTTPSSNGAAVPAIDTTSQLVSGSMVVTLAELQGKTPDKHLSFHKGELILVRDQKDATWYSGQLHGKIGWFPRNYVRPATDVESQNAKNSAKNTPTSEKALNSPAPSNGHSVGSPSDSIADIYESIYPYEAMDPSDLSFDVGERIIVLEKDGDWWKGKIGDRTGTFPNNYVQKIVNPLQETVVAVAAFHTTDEGRLSFDKGQLIYIRKKGDKGWYQGEIRTPDQPIRVGWFPANCVQTQTGVAPPSASNSSQLLYQNTSSTPVSSDLPRVKAIFPYEAQQDDELSFPADAILEILGDAGTAGWFRARLGSQLGLIPSTYVQPIDGQNQSSPAECRLLPNVFPYTPATTVSSKRLSAGDSTITTTSSDDMSTSSPFVTDTSQLASPARISAIRELIETEHRYVDDLRTVANDFIKPLTDTQVLTEHEIEPLFINWHSLIACNAIFLSALEEQVHFKENIQVSMNDVNLRTPRSASLQNIAAMAAQAPVINVTDTHHRSFIPHMSNSPSFPRIKHGGSHRHRDHHYRSPSAHALTSKQRLPGHHIEHVTDDSDVPSHHPDPFSHSSSSSMTVTESTRIGDILCSYLPYMADAYFQYCNCRSNANKLLQSKADFSEQFRTCLKAFQDKTGGLSLNGFLTKPIQRVTRYPLLIEKILKHTPTIHADYESLRKALECARHLNERINNQISEQESSARLDWLQQRLTLGSDENASDGYLFDEYLTFNSMTRFNKQRQLLLHGLVSKVPSGKELLAFLFNDFLLFAVMKTSSSHWQTQLFELQSNLQLKVYRMPIFLTDIIIANETLNDQLAFSIRTKIFEKPLVLRASQTNVRTLWVRAINNAVEECQATEKSILSDKALFATTENNRHSKTAIARLLLVVQEANDVMPATKTLDRHRSIDPYCEITVGSLTLKTPFMKRTIKPKWNAPMQFLLYDLNEDMIHINLFDHEYFSPNECLGSTSVTLVDILPCPLETFLTQPSLPFSQTIFLNNGASIIIKFVVQLLIPYQ